ncbi:MAG: restriction endonuclease [Candidatus Cybelea sp.]
MTNPDGAQAPWRTYEEVAEYLLNSLAHEFGLERVEGKQKVPGRSTEWEIDAKGVKLGDEGFVIVEAKRYLEARLDQERIGGLAFRIRDTGASGGIIVSPLGLQEGAQKVANQEGIIQVTLAADSTPREFVLRFLNKIFVGLADTLGPLSDSLSAQVIRGPCNTGNHDVCPGNCDCECHAAN